MRRIFSSITVLMMVVLFVTSAWAQSLTGQQYSAFSSSYAENLTFINENDGRYLIPQVIGKRKSDNRDGKYLYEVTGDVLSLTIRTDTTGETIEHCEIILTAPQGMKYGDALHNDFNNSGFHCYAMLMAMHTSSDVLERYQLVEDVTAGMAQAEEDYTMQVGVYSLTCRREGSSVIFTFVKDGLPQIADPEDADSSEEVVIVGEDDDGTSPQEDTPAGYENAG